MSGLADGPTGRVLGGRYQLLALIGTGASAEVYHAHDLRLGRSVAIKQLRSGYADDPRFLKLFRAEATLAAQLTHPNIMTVFDWSDDADGADGGPYLVTQMLPGGTLRGVLNRAGTYDPDGNLVEPGTLSAAQVGFIGFQAAQGLAFAHDQGLVHRDIKPANLLFGQDGRVHIGDFGIARAVAEAAWTEPEGVLIGTARYAAPEQATDAQIDGLADVYSLTLCLVEALTGDIPLVRENALGTMVQRQTTDVPVDPEWGPLADVLAMGGRSDPSQRATSDEFLTAIRKAVSASPDPEPLALLDLTDHPHTGAFNGPLDGLDDAPTAEEAARGYPATEVVEDGHVDHYSGHHQAGYDAPGHEAGGYRDPRPERPAGRMVRRLVALMLVLALAAGAVVGGLYLSQARQEVVTLNLTFPTFEVADYANMTAAEVSEAVSRAGWQVRSSQRYEDGTVPGQLLAQSPAPGTVLEPGSNQAIELVYSLGPELRVLPELVGADRADAEAAITAANLTVGSVTETNDEDAPAGVVMEATFEGEPVQAGEEFVTGTIIDLLVSTGPSPRTVPNVTAMSPDQARAALAEIGLELVVAEDYSKTVAQGAIISQSPDPGLQLPRGGSVTIVVSQGLPFVTVPELAGESTSAATRNLLDLGFKVTGVVGSPLDPVERTDPAAGESLRFGSEVTIYTR